jgi:hypothetical protein
MKNNQQLESIVGLHQEAANSAKPKRKTIFIKVPPKPWAPKSSAVVIRYLKPRGQ